MAVRAAYSHKGGVGKSTICAAIAGELAALGRSVLLIDCDRNYPFRLWQTSDFIPSAIDVAGVETVDLLYRVVEIGRTEFDEVVVDLPAGGFEIGLNAALVADVVLVPFRAAPLDVDEAIATRRTLIDFVREANRPLPLIVCVPSCLNSFAAHERIPREAIERILREPDIVLTYGTTERAAYRALFDPNLGGRTLQTMPDSTTAIEKVRSQAARIVSDLDDKLLRHRNECREAHHSHRRIEAE